MRPQNVPLSQRHRNDIRREVYETLAEANRGIFPHSLPHWERAARRFGLRIVMAPCVRAPHVKYNHFLECGILYLPETDNYRLLHLWCLHEIAEIAMTWTGRAPCNYPPHWGDHHQLAMVVDGRR